MAVVPQVTQFYISSGKIFRIHDMNPYPYLIYSNFFCRLWFWSDPQSRQGTVCEIWIDFAFQIFMTFSESLIQHY